MSRPRSNTEKFVRGSLVTFSGAVVLGVVNYLIRRTLANNLPENEYGFLFAAMSLIMLCLAFMDLGLGKAATIMQSKYLSHDDLEKSGAIYSLTFWLKVGLGLGMTVLFWVGTPFLVNCYFKYENGGMTFRVLSLSVPLTVAGGVLLSTLDAHRAFLTKTALNCFRSFIVLTAIVFFHRARLSLGPSMAYIAGPLVMIIIGIPLIRVRHKHSLVFSHLHKTREVFDELFHLSKWVAISTTGLLAMYNLDTAMLAYFTDMRHVALYNIALPIMQIIQSMMIFPVVFLPIATRMWHQKEITELRSVCNWVITLMLALLWPITIFFVLNGKMVIRVLFDAKYTDASTAACILCSAMCVFVICQFLLNVLNATGQEKVVGKIVLTGVAVNVTANAVLINFWGIEGAAMATCVSYAVIAGLAFTTLHSRIQLTLTWKSPACLFAFGVILTAVAVLVIQSRPLSWGWLFVWSVVLSGLHMILAVYFQRHTLGKMLRWMWRNSPWSQ